MIASSICSRSARNSEIIFEISMCLRVSHGLRAGIHRRCHLASATGWRKNSTPGMRSTKRRYSRKRSERVLPLWRHHAVALMLFLRRLIGGSHARTHQRQPILLSNAVASDAKDSLPKRTSSAVSESFMARRNCSKGLVATILALAVRAEDFKKCCLRTGAYDGERRNHFFPGVAITSWRLARRHRRLKALVTRCYRHLLWLLVLAL